MDPDTIRNTLLGMADEEYRRFHAKLIPTVDMCRIIGVRTPKLRAYAKSIGEADEFMKTLPHYYYEENNLHAFLIEKVKHYDDCVALLDEFLPFVDNWATCDMLSPKALRRYPEKTFACACRWMESDRTYTVRFGIKVLMDMFCDSDRAPVAAQKVADIKSEEYYVNMMRAWFFATLLYKNRDIAIEFLQSGELDGWTHNKAISKACDSYRITPEQKIILKGLRRKNG